MIDISVIIPVCNAEKFLPDMFKYLDAQTLSSSKFEIIFIAENCSTDCSVDLLINYCQNAANATLLLNENIITIEQRRNIGLSRNRGMEQAKGKYLCFVDVGDSIVPQYLEKMYDTIESDNSDIVFCGMQHIHNSTGKIIFTQPNKISRKILTSNRATLLKGAVCEKVMLTVRASIIRLSFLKEHGIIFPSLFCEDAVFMLDLFSVVDNISFVDECLYTGVLRDDHDLAYISEDYIYDIITIYKKRIAIALENDLDQNEIECRLISFVNNTIISRYEHIFQGDELTRRLLLIFVAMRAVVSIKKMHGLMTNKKFISIIDTYCLPDAALDSSFHYRKVVGCWQRHPSLDIKHEFGLRMKGIFKQNSSEKPLVTIITPILNGAKHLQQCLRSIQQQTYSNIEHIVIDGGSTDKTLEILKKNENHIDYCISEQDSGLYQAMNKGLLLASGQYINFLNSDDYFEVDAIESLIAQMQSQSPPANCCHGRTRIVDCDGNTAFLRGDQNDEMMYIYGLTFCAQSLLIKWNMYETIGFHDESFKIASVYKLMLKAYDLGYRFKSIDSVVVNFRNSGISTLSSKEGLYEKKLIREEYFPFLDETDQQILHDQMLITTEQKLELMSKYEDIKLRRALYHMLPQDQQQKIQCPQDTIAVVIGNGPSLRNFDFKSKLVGATTFGMNAAYQYWDKIGWYPDYYTCLNLKFDISHRQNIIRLITNAEQYGIKQFLLRNNLIETLGELKSNPMVVNFDQLSTTHPYLSSIRYTPGIHTCAWAAYLGFTEIVLLGFDSNYWVFGDKILDDGNVFILNANMNSELTCFHKMPFEEFPTWVSQHTVAKKFYENYLRSQQATINEDVMFLDYFGCKSGTMIEVGAHFGEGTIDHLERGWKVYAFEPDDANLAKCFTTTLSHAANLTLDERAVSDVSGQELPFYDSVESTGISTLFPFRYGHKYSKNVKTVTLSDYIEEQSISQVDYLKIDAEGFDLMVLKGFPFNKIMPKFILCKFEDLKTVLLGYTMVDMANFLVEKGYHVYVSEWHPIIRYRGAHIWHRFFEYPAPTVSLNVWGNLMAFKKKPYDGVLQFLLRKHVKLRPAMNQEQRKKLSFITTQLHPFLNNKLAMNQEQRKKLRANPPGQYFSRFVHPILKLLKDTSHS